MNAAIRKLDDSLGSAVSKTAFVLKRSLASRIRSGGYAVTPEELNLLETLEPTLGSPQGELVQSSLKDKTTVTRLVDGLARKGLLERAVDPNDRRAVMLRLTVGGKRLLAELSPLTTEVMDQARLGVSEDDMTTTMRTLNLVLKNCL